MNRAKTTSVVWRTLLPALVFSLLSGAAGAQERGRPKPGVARGPDGQRPFIGGMQQLPSWVTRRHLGDPTRAPGDQRVPRQTILLTRQNPADVNDRRPAPAADQHPFWTSDERYIFFSSNRVSNTDSAASADFDIFRMFADGSGMTQITTADSNEIEPAVSNSGNRMAYVSSADAATGFQLFVRNLVVPSQTDLSLTANNPSGFRFTDVRHPTWGTSDSLLAFSGRLEGQAVHQLFVVNADTGVITQMTFGPASNTAPAWSPDGNLIAFTTNAAGFNGAPATSTGTVANTDIWVINTSAFTPNPKRVTNGAFNGKQSSNKNASWSALRGDINLGFIRTLRLAFASNRADTDLNQPGIPTDVVATYDIYHITATIGPDPAVAGTFTVTTPESAGNPGLKLRTSTPDTAIDPGDPASSFDRNFQWDEDYPVWPQFTNTYRIAFQSNRGNNLNLWASTIIDINAPTLLKYDLASNSILQVARNSAPNIGIREVSAGEVVRFRTRVTDYETGVGSVWLQIKNPNSAPQAADGQEHKTFYTGGVTYRRPGGGTFFVFNGNGIFDNSAGAINAPYELDAQAINPTTYAFRPSGFVPPQYVTNMPNSWPGWNRYIPGIDDFFAYTGSLNPPDNEFWLRMWDNGPVSAGGNEPNGEVAGDGVYTNVWTTPSLQSDWYLDIIAYDNAVNPFPTATSVASNWKIFDNVWGFTTRPFQARSQMLYVNDYDIGQKFFQGRFGTGTTFLAFQSIPTESWMTEIDPGLLPNSYFSVTGGQGGIIANHRTTLGARGYFDGFTSPGPNGAAAVSAYDQWRVLSRGTIPNSVLNAYAPQVEVTPPDAIGGGGTPLNVLVAEKCIVWHSPYSGNLFTGPGTLLDGDTQRRLTDWLARGGRIFVNGQDLGWALTLGGGTSLFLNNTLKVLFPSIAFDDAIAIAPTQNMQINLVNTRQRNPISAQYWPLPFTHLYLPFDTDGTDNVPSEAAIYIDSVPGNPGTIREYGADNQFSPDVIVLNGVDQSADTSITPPLTGVDGRYPTGAGATPAQANHNIVWSIDGTTKSKVVFSSFGWEAVNPESVIANNVATLRNRRMQLMHNVGDFLRTGRIVGQVRNIEGATPIAGAFVRAVETWTGRTLSTALTLGDGTYILRGLDASGSYAIDAFSPGFFAQHLEGTIFHGGDESRVDVFLTPAQPGSISGKITRSTDNAPVPGAIVQAKDTVSEQTFTATSDTEGNYRIQNLPASIYDVTVTNIAALGYASSEPPSYEDVQVASNQEVTGRDFKLNPLPGNITGKVTNSVTDAGIAGATVTATLGTTVLTATTDANGDYTLPAPPGTYGVVASAPGFQTSASVTVNLASDTTITVNIELTPIPPGSISGLVTRTSDGQAVSGVAITVKDSGGNVLATGTTGASQTVNGYTFNYKINDVPAGQTVQVSAAIAGYTANPDTQGVVVNSGEETKGVNFSLQPLHTFSGGLSLVSAPYEYTTPIADLLGIPANDRANGNFRFFAWNAQPGAYVAFPNPPADTFHLGRGYWLGYTAGIALTTQGTALPTTPGTPFDIALQPGWNLIGDPYPFIVDFLNTKIIAGGQTLDIAQAQSGPDPIIGGALWTYQNNNYQIAYTLDPWKGYWIRVFKPCTLRIDPANRINRSASRALPASSRVPALDNGRGEGWKLDLMARAGAVNSAPGMLGLHRAATNGYDAFKLESPPVIGTEAVTLSFDHADWGDKSGRYSMDVRSAAASSQIWEFTVTSSLLNTPVTVSWPNAATVPGRMDMILTDMSTQAKLDLRTRGSVVIPASKTPITRRYRLEVRRATRQQLRLADVTARIHGGRGSSAPVSVGISYTLTADATVQVSILQNGRRIRIVEPGRTRAAGASEAMWDLKDDQGTAVPGSLYTVEVRAQDKDGRTVRATRPLLITR